MRYLVLLPWLASLGYYIFSAWCVRSFFRRERPRASGLPPVTMLKPVKGCDGNTYDNLRSFVAQDYPRLQVVFGLADSDDPAREAIARLAAEFPDRDMEVVVSGRSHGTNRKISNLCNMVPSAKYDIIIISDSDMRVGPDYAARVAAGFSDPSVGLVTCPYRGTLPEDAGAALEALTINADFLPSVIVAERIEGINFALGATMAVRRDALEAIGGLPALADYLADDYQLGNKVKKAGYGVALSDYLVDSVEGQKSIAGFFSHQLRWARTYRACRPAGYFFSVLTNGTAFSLAVLAASGFAVWGWAALALGLALRYAQALYAASFTKAEGTLGWYWLLPVRDLLGFAIWAMSFTGNKVRWKDEVFTIDSEGRMAAAGK